MVIHLEGRREMRKSVRGRDQGTEVVLTISDEYINRLDVIQAQLLQEGIEIESVLPGLGLINGYCNEEQLKWLPSVPGIVGIERSQRVDVAPPNSEIQ